ncbi:MAG: hypothetical protein C5B48_10070 [Candidatus Rokuibacteriota bacterium]|nr:MAG: hypothetical protein C5B48_10070 [Candidatus Rokubacteria bacterium]
MLVAAAVLSAALSTVALAGGSSTASWKRFASSRYGYSVQYPPGWTTVRATTSVLTGSFPLEIGAEVDKLLSCGDSCPKGIDVVVYARKLPAGKTLGAFATDETAALQEASRSVIKSRARGSLAGEPAIVLTCSHCLDNFLVEYAVVHHGQGFDVYLLAPPGHEARDRATFLHILNTFHFTR